MPPVAAILTTIPAAAAIRTIHNTHRAITPPLHGRARKAHLSTESASEHGKCKVIREKTMTVVELVPF